MLTDTEYTEGYYREHVKAGVDYLAYGDWHRNYASTIIDATLQRSYDNPAILDAGCACGALVVGFHEKLPEARCYGIDRSEAMAQMGRERFGLDAEHIMTGSIDTVPLPSASLTLINSGQVLEHIPDEIVDAVMAEFYRLLVPGGRMFHNLAALKHGDAPTIHNADPTHINVKPTAYWAGKFAKAGFLADFESYDRFARSQHNVAEGFGSFFSTYEIWTSFALMKPQ